MADTKRTIEILLQIKQQGQEAVAKLQQMLEEISPPIEEAKKNFDNLAESSKAAVDGVTKNLEGVSEASQQVAEDIKAVGAEAAQPLEQLKSQLKQVVPPVQQVGGAVKTMEADAKKSIDGTVTKFGGFRPAANAALTAVKGFASGARTALAGIEVAAEAAWAAITFGASAVLKALSFLNPFSVKGLLTGAAFGGAGLIAKNWVEAADGVDVYRKRLGILIGDQAIANRVFDEFEKRSEQVGVSAEQQAEVFARLYEFRVRDAEAATKTVTGVAAFLQKDAGSILDALSNPNARGLKQFGIDLNNLGTQAELVSGRIRKVVANTEEGIRQGLIDLLAEKFPNALNDAQQSFATKFATLRAILGQYAQDFGYILLPAAKDVLDKINNFLRENRDVIVATIKSIPEIVRTVIAEIDGLLSSGKAFSTIDPILQRINRAVAIFLVDLYDVVIAWLKLLAVPVGAYFKVILAQLQAAWEIFAQNLIPSLINGIAKSATPAIQNSRLLNLLPKDLKRTIIEAAGSSVDGGILPVTPIEKAFDGLKGKVDKGIADSWKDAKEKAGDVKDAVSKLFSNVGEQARGTGGLLGEIFGPILVKLGDIINKEKEAAAAAGKANRSSAPLLRSAAPLDPETLTSIDTLRASSLDRELAANQRAYEADLASYKNAILSKVASEAELAKYKEYLQQKAYDLPVSDFLKYQQAIESRRAAMEKLAEAEDGLRRRKEAADSEAFARQKAIQNDFVVSVSTGFDKMFAENQRAYDADLAKWTKLQNEKAITSEQFKVFEANAAKQLNDANTRVVSQMQIARDEFNIVVTRGVGRMFAEVQLSYDRDVASWQERQQKGLISEAQFNAAVVSLNQQRAERIHEIELQMKAASDQLNVLVLNSQHRITEARLAEIQISLDTQEEAYRKLYADGLINEKQFLDAIIALETQAAEKRTEQTGTFVEGFGLGVQRMMDGLETMAQLGIHASELVADGFATAFGEMVSGTKSASEAFRSMAAGILQDLARIIARQAIVNALSSVFGGKGGGGIFGSIGNAIGGFFTANDGGVVPGTGPDVDSVPAILTPGEFVVRRNAVQQPGILSLLHAINSSMPQAHHVAAAGAIQQLNAGGLVNSIPKDAGTRETTTVLPVVAASDAQMRTLAFGGKTALIDFMRSHSSEINAALEKN